MYIRITSSARRRHRINKNRIKYVIETTIPTVTQVGTVDEGYQWIGVDNRGEELEVVAVIVPDCLLVIHAMPTKFRRKK